MQWRGGRWWAVALVVGILGCSSDNEPKPLTGTWTGTLQDSLAGRGSLVLNLSQTNRQVTGTWQSTFPDARNNNGGTLSGTGPGQGLMIKMVWSHVQRGAGPSRGRSGRARYLAELGGTAQSRWRGEAAQALKEHTSPQVQRWGAN